MSLLRADRDKLETALVMLGALIALAWYAQGQLLHSLRFLYQLATLIFPGLSALDAGPGGQ